MQKSKKMNESPVERCEPDSPNRCQATNSQGQCNNAAVEGGTHCLVHGGNKQLESQRNASLRNYRLTKWQAKLERHAESDSIKSLRDEVGILRILMEERLNQCSTDMDLLLHSGAISDLVMKIDRVVTSCHKLEGQMGQLLDKSALLQFAGRIIDVIGSELEGQDEIMNTIADKILEIISENVEEEK